MSKEFIKRILSSIILIPIVIFAIIKGSIFFNLLIFFCLIISLYEWHMMSKKKSIYIIGIFFLLFSFYTVYILRVDTELNFFLLIIFICIATDIGGYTFGKIFKGPKLTKISPNKTYAGMFGGFFLAIIFSYLFYSNLKIFNLGENTQISKQIFLIIFLISFVSQIGDLIISFFKRKSNIKNTGNIIPGHGGLLDRIDGMIFAFPFIFFLNKLI